MMEDSYTKQLKKFSKLTAQRFIAVKRWPLDRDSCWRSMAFPRNGIEQCLTNSKRTRRGRAGKRVPWRLERFTDCCLEPIQEVFATAADVAAVTTTLEGNP